VKIAIIGRGRIGTGLGRCWSAKGHQIVYGIRAPDDAEAQSMAAELGARVDTVAAAAEAAEVVVLAVPYPAVGEVLEATGGLAGKIVIDCTNALARGMKLEYGHHTSAAEKLQERIPDAKVFKSFNAQGAENLSAPVYGSARASNFFCGDDHEARGIVRQLVEEVGFDPVDAGPLVSARLVEPMMLLWIAAAQAVGTRDVAFALMRR